MSRVTFGTASAPVSRHASRDERDLEEHNSGTTLNEPVGTGTGGPTMYFRDGSPTTASPPASHAIQSYSAPSSPHPIDDHSAGGAGFPLGQERTGETMVGPDTGATLGTGGEPVAGRPSAKRGHSYGQDGGRRSGRSTPHAGYQDPFFAYRSFENRPASHQASYHKTPLYSLARPLPTREQRDAQRAYRDEIRGKLDTHKKHKGATHAFIAPQHPHATQAHPSAMGPGALHHGGVPGPASFAQQPYYGSQHSFRGAAPGPTGFDKLELMAMLREVLNEEQGGKATKDGKEIDVRDDEGLASKKEGYGRDSRTARAERRDSIGSDTSSETEEEEEFPNPWARVRHFLREPFAEFLGTMILVMFGTGVSLQYFLSLNTDVASSPRGTYTSVSLGWGIGVGMGVWVAGGISGGHINPAVTLCLAVFRGFPWKKVPGYWIAQILGSTCGAGLNYALYRRAISIFEGGMGIRTVTGDTATASLFSTYTLDYVTSATAFFQEFVNSAILLLVVLAISDTNNASPPDGLNPLVLFLLITGIGASLGMQTAYCINPARDLGPRLVTWFAGYGREVWNYRSQYWLWVPVCATMSGALFGSFLYDALIYTGSESPLNIKWSFPKKKQNRAGFGPASKEKMPAGQLEA